MKILVVHNYYQQTSGEEESVQQEITLLREHGHEVIVYTRSNREAADLDWRGKLTLPVQMIWSAESYQQLASLLERERPDIAHFSNTHFMISPAAFHACDAAGVPTVLTLRNYRLLCPEATLMRDGKVCEACLNKTPPWPGVVYGCWRKSRPLTAIMAANLTAHRLLGTWQHKVTRYIALTEFARRKFIQGGLPAERIVVRPNFLEPDPGMGTHDGDFALFVGRLAPEKGLDVLLNAYGAARETLGRLPLKIVGDGPEMGRVRAQVARLGAPEVELMGWQSGADVLKLMKQARALVFPSVWYEGMPRVLIEAFACGLPVISSRLGSMAEIITHQQNGLHFEPGNASDLAEQWVWAWQHPQELQQLAGSARRDYETRYRADVNYQRLMDIYEAAQNAFSPAGT